jgi:hypothetical protein
MAAWGQPATPNPFDPSNGMASPINPVTSSIPIQQMAGGGPVRDQGGIPVINRNFGSMSAGPQLMRGPAGPGISTSMGQGITPASDEGQLQTYDMGGPIDNTVQQAQTLRPEVSGRAAGITSGIASGQVMGQNILNAYHNSQARDAAKQQGKAAVGIESAATGVAAPEDPQSLAQKFDDTITQFAHHIHGALFGDPVNDTQPNQGPYPLHPTGGVNPVPGGPPSPYARPDTPGIPPAAGASPSGPTGAPSPVPGAAGAASAPVPGAAGAGGAPPPVGVAPGGGPPNVTGIAGLNAPANTQVPNVTPGGPANAPPVSPAGPPAGQGGEAYTAAAAGTKPDIAKAGAQGAAEYQQTGTIKPIPASVGITPEWWEHSEQLKMQAMQNAYKMGKDPREVGASMDAIRTGAFQGQANHILSGVNAALDAGNMDAVAQGIKNLYHFIPNGQDLDVKKSTQADVDKNNALATGGPNDGPKPGYDPTLNAAGMVMYKNPYANMPGYENAPQYQVINKQHLGDLFQNIMDPQNANKNLYAGYTAQVNARSEIAKAQASTTNAAARWQISSAQMLKATSADEMNKALLSYKQAVMGATAGSLDAKSLAVMNKGTAGQPKVTMASIRAAQNDASTEVDNQIRGPIVTQPQFIPNPSAPGQQMLNPKQTGRDPTQASPMFANMTAEDAAHVKGIAATLATSNAGTSNKNDIAIAAAQIYKYENGVTKPVHVDPKTGEMRPDVMRDLHQGTIHVLDGHQMKNFYMHANISDSDGSPVNSSNDTPATEAAGSSRGEAEDAASSSSVMSPDDSN